MAATKRGKPAPENTRLALLAAAQAPRSKFIAPPLHSQYSAREDAFIKRWRGRLTVHEIANHLGRSHASVARRILTLNLDRVLPPAWSAADNARLATMWPSHTAAQLADVFDRTQRAIYWQIRALGLNARRAAKEST